MGEKKKRKLVYSFNSSFCLATVKPGTEWKISVLNNCPIRSSHLKPIYMRYFSTKKVWEPLQQSQLSHFYKERLFLKYVGYVIWFSFSIFKHQLHLHKLLWFKKMHSYLHINNEEQSTWCIQVRQLHSRTNWELCS